jgi:hypothetical protein
MVPYKLQKSKSLQYLCFIYSYCIFIIPNNRVVQLTITLLLKRIRRAEILVVIIQKNRGSIESKLSLKYIRWLKIWKNNNQGLHSDLLGFSPIDWMICNKWQLQTWNWKLKIEKQIKNENLVYFIWRRNDWNVDVFRRQFRDCSKVTNDESHQISAHLDALLELIANLLVSYRNCFYLFWQIISKSYHSHQGRREKWKCAILVNFHSALVTCRFCFL